MNHYGCAPLDEVYSAIHSGNELLLLRLLKGGAKTSFFKDPVRDAYAVLFGGMLSVFRFQLRPQQSDLDRFLRLGETLCKLGKKPDVEAMNALISAMDHEAVFRTETIIAYGNKLLEWGAEIEMIMPPSPDKVVRSWNRDIPMREWQIEAREGCSPLHYAAARGEPELVEWLIGVGGDIDVRCSYGTTPLMVAVSKGNVEAADLLIRKGADVSLKTNFGTTPSQLASTSEMKQLLELRKRFSKGKLNSKARIGNGKFSTGLIHRSASGDLVRSKSEVIIADALFYSEVDFEYELALPLEEDGESVVPDFTMQGVSGEIFVWEHLGMEDEEYRRRWAKKLRLYRENGFLLGRNLFVTEDVEGSIDSQAVLKTVRRIKRRLNAKDV